MGRPLWQWRGRSVWGGYRDSRKEAGEGPILALVEGNQGRGKFLRRRRETRGGARPCAGGGGPRRTRFSRRWGGGQGGSEGSGTRGNGGEAVAAVVLTPTAGRQWSSRRRLRAVERPSTRRRRGGSGGLEGKTAREEQERVSTARIEECVDKAVGEFFPPSRRTWLVFHLLFSLPRVVVD
jgi:hypothetical protein